MSGVEAIAIVSAVAGLIQALDAGCRIVKQIKQRRRAHRADGALPPSDELERTIEDGKNNIQKLVEKGSKRFGPEFEEGDEIAQMAIMKITIQIQNVLLNRLTQARADDGVVDFAECIDLSDQGCMKALTALQELYQRKLEESLHKEQESVPEERKDTERPPVAQRKTEPPVSTQQKHHEQAFESKKPPVEREQPMRMSTSERKNSRGLRGLFQSKSGDDPKPRSAVQPIYQRTQTAPAEIPKPFRSSTMTTVDTSPTSHRISRVSLSSQNSSNPDQSSSPRRDTESHTWTQGMSRASTLEPNALNEPMMRTSLTETAKIAKYGGSCKYAFQIRDHGPKGNLEAQNLAMYTENWVYKCSSSKCKFQRQIRHPKARDPLDNTVHTRNGIEFRWLFLAKSHCLHTVASSAFPFVCLVCQLLNGDPKQYCGIDELFAHIAEHQEEDVGGVPLEGPLTFSNKGIKIDPEFDLNLPRRQRKSQRRSTGHDLSEHEKHYARLEEAESDRKSKTSSMVSHQTGESSLSTDTDLYVNHWASE